MMFNEESIATRLKLKIGGLTLTNVDKLDLKEVNTIFRRMGGVFDICLSTTTNGGQRPWVYYEAGIVRSHHGMVRQRVKWDKGCSQPSNNWTEQEANAKSLFFSIVLPIFQSFVKWTN
jgi:hypothetical protein